MSVEPVPKGKKITKPGFRVSNSANGKHNSCDKPLTMQSQLTFTNPSFEDLSGKEWLVTNSLGGYASSTLSGANTRRYHGMFVPAMHPPTGRMVIVSKIEETLITPRGSWTDLSSNTYPGVIHPQGYRYLTQFDRLPVPTSCG